MAFGLFKKKKSGARMDSPAPRPEISQKIEPAAQSPAARTDQGTNGTGDEKLFDLNAVPAKEILRNKASVCPPLSACCEIVDNIFDNFEENGAKGQLTVRFIVETNAQPGKISILENSGGVRKEKLEPLVRLGVPYHGAKGSIGTWGEGLKVAAFSLARDVEIRTSFPGEQAVSINFGPDWLSKAEWSVPVYSAKNRPPPVGTTQFLLKNLVREVDWSMVIREVSTIYGHKIIDLEQGGAKVSLEFVVNGSSTTVTPHPLAAPESLALRMAYPADFSPRTFVAEWQGAHGKVRSRIVIGLTAHHSSETSGVYIYGNGRLFARAQRTRTVGYGDSGKSFLRDHPSCWRVHIYAFIEAEDGADIPWQAPLKDGVSENHEVTARLRELIKKTVGPYSRFAKIAKESDLVPHTIEWNETGENDRSKLLFGADVADRIERLRKLPASFQHFTAPTAIESIEINSPAFEKLAAKLERQYTYARVVIAKRDEQGQVLQEMALRALNPKAFSALPAEPFVGKPSDAIPQTIHVARTQRVTVELREVHLKRLREVFGIDDDREAVQSAIKFALEKLEKKSMRRV